MEKTICNAKTRNGKPCKKPVVPGKSRCRLHGGENSGPPAMNQNALKHGLYARCPLNDEERKLLPKIPVGSIEDELRILRLQLRRVLMIERDYLEARLTDQDTMAGFELSEVELKQGAALCPQAAEAGEQPAVPMAEIKKVHKRPDFDARVRSLVRLIADLERIRIQVLPFNRNLQAQQQVSKILKKLRTGRLGVMEAALLIEEAGLALPDSVRIMLQNTPAPVEEEEPEEYGKTIEEIEREYEEKMAESKRQESEFVPAREVEIEEAKAELTEFEVFDADFDPNNPSGTPIGK